MGSVSSFRDDQIAREAVQWIQRLGTPPSSDLNDEFSAWLVRSADHVQHFLQATAVLSELSDLPGREPLRLVKQTPENRLAGGDPIGTSGESDAFAALRRAVMQLPQECRRAITLRKVYGCSGLEIAERLKTSQETIEATLVEASLRLGRLL